MDTQIAVTPVARHRLPMTEAKGTKAGEEPQARYLNGSEESMKLRLLNSALGKRSPQAYYVSGNTRLLSPLLH